MAIKVDDEIIEQAFNDASKELADEMFSNGMEDVFILFQAAIARGVRKFGRKVELRHLQFVWHEGRLDNKRYNQLCRKLQWKYDWGFYTCSDDFLATDRWQGLNERYA